MVRGITVKYILHNETEVQVKNFELFTLSKNSISGKKQNNSQIEKICMNARESAGKSLYGIQRDSFVGVYIRHYNQLLRFPILDN